MPPFSIFPRIAEIALLSGIVDGFPDMKPKFSRDMGTNPLEDGTIITDHVVTLPEVLVLDAEASTRLSPRVRGNRAYPRAARSRDQRARRHAWGLALEPKGDVGLVAQAGMPA